MKYFTNKFTKNAFFPRAGRLLKYPGGKILRNYVKNFTIILWR
ncbi:hypothetical protein KIS4809_0039 [Bacillus sp. ZZV12-4809]|nr:hypothetical protein KIS4809_0039 [Bacillus sp. ZZV12-4809]